MPEKPRRSSPRPALLFTAFDDDGDARAAPVIAQLRQAVADLPIYACGGPRMERAGAAIVERTAGPPPDGAAPKRRRTAGGIGRAMGRWAGEHRVGVLVACGPHRLNRPVVRALHRHGAKIVYLGAPRLWRRRRAGVGRLRREATVVICDLPFEPPWFTDRGVPARFVGHPTFSRRIDGRELRERMHGLPQGAPRVLLYPGQTPAEVRGNMNLLIEVFAELQGRHSGMGGVIQADTPAINRVIRKRIGVFPTGLHMVTDMLDAGIGWCDLAVIVAGPAALRVTRQRKPMIAVRHASLLAWPLEMLRAGNRLQLVPNIIADREIVPEFIPHAGGAGPIVKQAMRYVQDSKHAAVQSEALARVCLRFANKKPVEESARIILKVLRDGKV